mmetsp:Transcript_7962/g.15544  ORF Transcript_7962/g.15544 Transcript_7962/m.15544 type:complete len:213 (-) Transcript_7962:4083-4721(-)
MESRAKKLIVLLETTKSPDAAQLASFQLGELAKELFAPILKLLLPLLKHKDENVRNYGANTLSRCIFKSGVKALADQSAKKPCFDYSLEALVSDLRETLMNDAWEAKHGSLLGLNVILSEVELPCELRETLTDELIHILKEDRTADYSSDMPSFPIREVASKALAALITVQQKHEVERRLLDFYGVTSDFLGPLMALRQINSFRCFKVLNNW